MVLVAVLGFLDLASDHADCRRSRRRGRTEHDRGRSVARWAGARRKSSCGVGGARNLGYPARLGRRGPPRPCALDLQSDSFARLPNAPRASRPADGLRPLSGRVMASRKQGEHECLCRGASCIFLPRALRTGMRCDGHLLPITGRVAHWHPRPINRTSGAAASHRRDFRVDTEHPMNAKAELEEYFREAESWDANRMEQALRNASWRDGRRRWMDLRRRLRRGAAAAHAPEACRALRRTRRQRTGIVDVVPIYDGRATPQEAVTRYFLTHYVTTCERFNFATAESDYEECGAFHSPARNQIWYSQWTATNPASPLNVHKDGSTVRAQVTSVSFFTRANGITDLAQVRYLKALRQGAGSEEIFSHWVATIQYSYTEPAKDPRTAAGIRWGSRSWSSRRSRRCRSMDSPTRITVMIQ